MIKQSPFWLESITGIETFKSVLFFIFDVVSDRFCKNRFLPHALIQFRF